MNDLKEGVIKYQLMDFDQTTPVKVDEIEQLEKWRNRLFKLKLIGEYLPERLGYGNLSQKKDYQSLFLSKCPQFIISGTQTGGLEHLLPSHYTRVVNFNLDGHKIWINGAVKASSEALTHAAIYQAHSEIQAVLHVHHFNMWEKMIRQEFPSTPETVSYGTIEMADATKAIIGDNPESGLFVMKGHKEGIISYGKSLEQAGNILLEHFHKLVEV